MFATAEVTPRHTVSLHSAGYLFIVGILIAHTSQVEQGPLSLCVRKSIATSGLTMTTFRPWSVLVLLACLGTVALHASPATADPLNVSHGATYLLTIKDASTG